MLKKSIAGVIDSTVVGDKTATRCQFAAHLYRASDSTGRQTEKIFSQFGHSTLVPSASLREIPFIFAELRDSDIDWMIYAGSKQNCRRHCPDPGRVTCGGAISS